MNWCDRTEPGGDQVQEALAMMDVTCLELKIRSRVLPLPEGISAGFVGAVATLFQKAQIYIFLLYHICAKAAVPVVIWRLL